MAQIVAFFDRNNNLISEFVGKSDFLVAQMFAEFVVDVLQDRGLAVRSAITSDETQIEGAWPNLREATEQLTAILRRRPANIES